MSGRRIGLSGVVKAVLVVSALVAASVVLAVLILFISLKRPNPAFRLRYKLRNMTIAMSSYQKDLGALPPAEDATDLARILSSVSVTERDGRHYGPYMIFREKTPEKAALDPWGTALLYERSPDGQSFKLGCAGPDRKFGTEDDIFIGDDGVFIGTEDRGWD